MWNLATTWPCTSKRPSCRTPDKTQKDQSRCTEKITSARICYDIWGGGLPTKALLKTRAVQLFGDINVCWQHVGTQKSIQVFMTPPSPFCQAFKRNGSDGDKAWPRWKWGGDRGPSHSFLQAVLVAISCCFISRLVEVIRRANTVSSRQVGLTVISTFQITQHIIYKLTVAFFGNMATNLTYLFQQGQLCNSIPLICFYSLHPIQHPH